LHAILLRSRVPLRLHRWLSGWPAGPQISRRWLVHENRRGRVLLAASLLQHNAVFQTEIEVIVGVSTLTSRANLHCPYPLGAAERAISGEVIISTNLKKSLAGYDLRPNEVQALACRLYILTDEFKRYVTAGAREKPGRRKFLQKQRGPSSNIRIDGNPKLLSTNG
jgi:hypothetical protein